MSEIKTLPKTACAKPSYDDLGRLITIMDQANALGQEASEIIARTLGAENPESVRDAGVAFKYTGLGPNRQSIEVTTIDVTITISQGCYDHSAEVCCAGPCPC